jgi:hypothetical protein
MAKISIDNQMVSVSARCGETEWKYSEMERRRRNKVEVRRNWAACPFLDSLVLGRFFLRERTEWVFKYSLVK